MIYDLMFGVIHIHYVLNILNPRLTSEQHVLHIKHFHHLIFHQILILQIILHF
jgi:hypothetical protein